MKKEIIDALKTNSINLLNEATDSSSVQSGLDSLIGNVIETAIPKSIASNVCSVQPLFNGPNGKVFGVKRTLDTVTNEIKLKVASKTVNSNYSKRFKSSFTTEFIQDLASTTGFIEADLFKQTTAAESSTYVDSVIVPVLRNLAIPMQPVVLDGSPETAYFQLLYNVHLALVSINNSTKRGISGYAILSPSLAAIFAQFNDIYNDGEQPDRVYNRNIYFLGKTHQVEYYIDPMAPKDDVVVGYKSEIEGETALIYCPYSFMLYKTVDAENSDTFYHNVTRFGYSRNPLDSGVANHDCDFLRIFNCDISNVGDMTNSGGGTGIASPLSNYKRDDSVATAGQTVITSTGSGVIPRLFVNGEYIEDRFYTWSAPNVTLIKPLNANDSISLETYDIV